MKKRKTPPPSTAIITVAHSGGKVRGEDTTGRPIEMQIPNSTRYMQEILEPGQEFETSDGRVYVGGRNGSLRRPGRVQETKKQRKARRAMAAWRAARGLYP